MCVFVLCVFVLLVVFFFSCVYLTLCCYALCENLNTSRLEPFNKITKHMQIKHSKSRTAIRAHNPSTQMTFFYSKDETVNLCAGKYCVLIIASLFDDGPEFCAVLGIVEQSIERSYLNVDCCGIVTFQSRCSCKELWVPAFEKPHRGVVVAVDETGRSSDFYGAHRDLAKRRTLRGFPRFRGLRRLPRLRRLRVCGLGGRRRLHRLRLRLWHDDDDG